VLTGRVRRQIGRDDIAREPEAVASSVTVLAGAAYACVSPAGGAAPRGYDSSMSERKSRLTITVDPDLSSYAERLVASGQAASVSAAFNEAMAEKAYRDRRRRGLWKARGDQADPGRVARMMAHVDQQLAGE
jgi:hypothetical protein